MSKAVSKTAARRKRHVRLRKKVLGTPDRPRMVVTKSLSGIYVQCIDDTAGNTVCSASTIEKAFRGEPLKSRKNAEAMGKLAEHLLSKLKERGITSVRFDRSGYKYHGKLKQLAEKLREAGIEL
jgi:large subunit ribosomal protein L18